MGSVVLSKNPVKTFNVRPMAYKKSIKRQQKQAMLDKINKEAYVRKYEEYDKLTLDELKDIFNSKDKKKRVGGIYKTALIDVCIKKQRETKPVETTEKVEETSVNTEPTNVEEINQ